jgi:hypothetical protein
MKKGTKHLLLKLIDEKKESYERAIYSMYISRPKEFETAIKRHQKKISELEKARNDLIGPKATDPTE